MIIPLRYGTQQAVEFSMVKRGVVDLAATADWTPATGDTKISKDGGNYANTTNNPSAVGGSGSVGWTLTLTAAETQCARIRIQIVDSATKAVEDQFLYCQVLPSEAYDALYGGTYRVNWVDAPNMSAPATQAFDSDATTHNVTMPATVHAGDLLIVAFTNDGNDTVTVPSGWKALSSDANSTVVRLSIFARIADGTEGGTNVDFVTSGSQQGTAIVVKFAAGTFYPSLDTIGIAVGTAATGTSTTPDPPSVTIPWGASANCVVMSFYGADDQAQATAYPAAYQSGTTIQGANATGASTGVAVNTLAAASENPGSFTTASQEWVAQTIAIRKSRENDAGVDMSMRRGVAQGGAAGSITLDDDAVATDDYYKGAIVAVIGGTGAGQTRIVTGYTGASRVATVSPNWATNPGSSSEFLVMPQGPANTQMMNGGALDGNNATVKLKQLEIVNSGGSALVATSTGADGHGFAATGNGSGHGVLGTGGATGDGLKGSGLNGIRGAGSDHGLYVTAAGSAHGIYAVGSGSGSGMRSEGGATGHGVLALGGATSGDGLRGSATSGDGIAGIGGTNGDGLALTGAGSGEGISATGGATGAGIHAIGGVTSGAGFRARANGSGIGFQAQGIGGWSGIHASSSGTGYGIEAGGGVTSGHGIYAYANTTGHGIYAQAWGTGDGVKADGAGTGSGIKATGVGTGDGITAVGGAASGATPAGQGINTTGGAASTTGGGVSGNGIRVTGGAGAASTNGAGDGLKTTGGGTTTVSGGTGLSAVGSGNSAGLKADGAGTGAGISATGGASADGLLATGGSSVGSGIRATATASGEYGLYASGSGAGAGIVGVGGTSGAGIEASAGSTGHAFWGYATSGDGMRLEGGTNGHGLKVNGAGTGEGISATGGANGAGIQATGGSSSGDGINTGAVGDGVGIRAVGTGTGNAGIQADSGTNAHGIWSRANGTGSGFRVEGGATGHGIYVTCPAGSSGDGIRAVGGDASGAAPAGHGLNVTGGAASTTGGGTAGIGLRAKGGAGAASTNGSGDGLVTDPGGTVTVSRGFAFKSADYTGAVVSDGSNTSSTFKTDRTETQTDHWKEAFVRFTSGTLLGQVRRCSAYDGTTKFISVDTAFSTAPTASDTFELINE